MTKRQQVLNHLKQFKTITPAEALFMYGVTNLASEIYILRKRYGMNIQIKNQYHMNPVKSQYMLCD